MNAQSEGGGRGALAPLANPTFRAIWIASLASNFGGLIQAVGAAWMMTSITASADMVALVQASTTLPIMLFSLAAGAIADNFDRRRVMLTAQLFMLAVSVALALCAWFGPADALAAARLHLPDRLRHRAQQPVLAGLGRRHRAARRTCRRRSRSTASAST